jgi:hypothetical protein
VELFDWLLVETAPDAEVEAAWKKGNPPALACFLQALTPLLLVSRLLALLAVFY